MMNKPLGSIRSQNILMFTAIATLAMAGLSFPAKSQDIPNFSVDEASGLPAGPTMSGATPGFGAGPEDDIFGLDDSFDFEKTPQQLEEEIRSQAFNAALEGMLPLRPEEIRILLERYDRTQESVVTPIYPDPKPLSVVETLAMDPGTEPTRIKTALGHITTLNFIDITGKPWPVQSLSWAGDFEVMQNVGDPEKGENIVRVSPRTEFARGNMSIKMIDLDSPIIIMLTTDRDEVHYRFDATVPQRGPMAEIPIIDRGITLTAGRSDISDMLQGIMPNSALKLNVSGVDGRTTAYSYNGMTYLRTPLTLLSPGWNNSVASSDGMRVYELQSTPVVLLSEKGKMVRAQLSDREDLLNEQ
ncbi:MAG: DotH/IcmK family type IV secretion protein [Alphaproteobacteria bacterium]